MCHEHGTCGVSPEAAVAGAGTNAIVLDAATSSTWQEPTKGDDRIAVRRSCRDEEPTWKRGSEVMDLMDVSDRCR